MAPGYTRCPPWAWRVMGAAVKAGSGPGQGVCYGSLKPAAVEGELDRVSQTLTGRIRELAERYATSLPVLTQEVETLSARVDEHLKKMGASWK